jgi:hypothetical protein
MEITIRTIRDIAEKDRIAFKKHSILRMCERGIYADEVKNVLLKGEIIEYYPDIRPLPCYLILGHEPGKNPIHAVAAVDTDEQMLWIITVYHPSEDEWDSGFKRRNSP